MSDPAIPVAKAEAVPAATARPSKISPEEKEKIQAWFEKNAKEAKCPVCGTGKWSVLEDYVSPVTSYPNSGHHDLAGPIYPHFMLACSTCGNVQFINVFGAGLTPNTRPIE